MKSTNQNISSTSLFIQFLKIGATSFGGFMALISLVEKQFVERNKLVKGEDLLDTISVASMLPGPMAVNVVAFVGYKLRGIKGAMISIFAVLLPTMILIILLSHFYFKYDSLPQVNSAFKGIVPAVCAIIVSVAINMSKKNLKDLKMLIICLSAALLYVFIGGFFVTLIIIITAGFFGWLIYGREKIGDKTQPKTIKYSWSVYRKNRAFFISLIILMALIIISPIIVNFQGTIFYELRKLSMTFGMVSVSLFGGGYVFIPMLQELIVENMQWLTAKEFIDGIALGQITPGPIMISAAFVGYKVAGVSGAIISTIAMFLPPALIMIIVSSFLEDVKKSRILSAAFKGIRAAVIGMIFAAAWVIGKSVSLEVIPILILISVFCLQFFLKWNIVYLIPVSGLLGLILL